MIKYNKPYSIDNGKISINFSESENGTITGLYKDGIIKGNLNGNVLKGTFSNKSANVEGLIEFTFHENGFVGKWKKGLEPGNMKGRWTGELLDIKTDNLSLKWGSSGSKWGTATDDELYDDNKSIVVPDSLLEKFEPEVEKESYQGEIKNGLRHGKGIYKSDNGDVYEGDFVDGSFHGKGKLVSKDGDVYEGDFVDGKKHGKGLYKVVNVFIYEGDFVNDEFHGNGKWIDIDDDGFFYKGDFVAGKFHGKGIYKSSNGDVYDGDFVDDEFHGKGIQKFANGNVNKGEFRNGEFLGEPIKPKSVTRMPSANISRPDNSAKPVQKNSIQNAVKKQYLIKYKIKLTQSKSTTKVKGAEFGFLGILFNGAKTQKLKTHSKGEFIERKITVYHIGSLFKGDAMKYIISEDQDVKAGKAGTSTIIIDQIKEI